MCCAFFVKVLLTQDLCLLFGAVRVDARSGEYAVMRVESAVDGISKAVVLLQF